jgi:cation diffusion facilitator family transporter
MTSGISTEAVIKKKIMITVLILSCFLFVIKFVAYFLTHSSSILSDALESTVNIITGIFALYSIYYSSKPKDADHPYGHGKIEFFSSGFEGSMILLAGLSMMYNGATLFFKPSELTRLDVGLLFTIIAGLLNFIAGRVLLQKGKQFNSSTLTAEGKHLLSDTYSSIAIVVGLTVIYFTGVNWLDYLISIGMGLFIAYSGFKLVKHAIDNLLDKADIDELNKLILTLEKNKKNEWIDMHNLRVLKYGDHLHVDAHVTLPFYLSFENAHDEIDAISKLIRQELGEKIELFIHADPCVRPVSCSICPNNLCTSRQVGFVKRINWELKNVLPDLKHQA